jgi:hypothetical protein
MNGNVTREGITADLEAMKRVGIGGAQIFNVDCGIPAGPVKFMSPEWLELVKHAAQEAQRLGLELCMHNCAGWSSSGGPWNTPEHAMQDLTTSERRVTGPKHFSGVLPAPPAKLDVYRDIAVLAFPAPAGTNKTPGSLQDYPQCDAEVKQLAARVWGDCDGRRVTQHPYGQGKAVWNRPLAQVLGELDLKPDFEYPATSGAKLAFIHRCGPTA